MQDYCDMCLRAKLELKLHNAIKAIVMDTSVTIDEVIETLRESRDEINEHIQVLYNHKD